MDEHFSSSFPEIRLREVAALALPSTLLINRNPATVHSWVEVLNEALSRGR